MILISKNNWMQTLLTVVIGLLLLVTRTTLAQESQTISVSPTLFDMTASAEQIWQSELRVTNVNDYDIIVYPQVVNFAPLGETGRGDFIPVFEEETQGKTLAEWINLPPIGITIIRQETKTIRFDIKVPKDAAPGGHYAAILIGTKPPIEAGNSEVQTAQFVTSLFFLRVAGDISERGTIREFTTKKSLIPSPEAEFLLRFENEGNVHLQPQGDITISNMWGEERGIIPINQQTHFGNVLPMSVRQFTFSWSGEYSVFDIGRYTAIATLGFGQEAKKFTTSTTYFWIIPIKQISIVLIILTFLIWFIGFAVRLYVKRMLQLAGIEPRRRTTLQQQNASPVISSVSVEKTVIIKRYHTVTAPIVIGVFELLTSWKKATSWRQKLFAIWRFLVSYRIFFAAIIALALLTITAWIYMHAVTMTDRSYQVTITNQGERVSLSSEQIIYNSLPTAPATATSSLQNYKLIISNTSGKSGVAAQTRLRLESLGYTVSEITTNTESVKEATVIVYNNVNEAELLKLSSHLGNVLISASTLLPDASVIVYVAADQLPN